MEGVIHKSIVILALVIGVGSATARPNIVTGTNNSAVDIRAVQAAVDEGGDVILTGHFSFDAVPSTPAGAVTRES
jgi:hypothetical protein